MDINVDFFSNLNIDNKMVNKKTYFDGIENSNNTNIVSDLLGDSENITNILKKNNLLNLDIASFKIIELLKKIREQNSLLVSERNKSVKLSKRIQDLEVEIQNVKNEKNLNNVIIETKTNNNNLKNEIKCDVYKKKIKEKDDLIHKLQCKIENQKQNLNLAKKIVELETGQIITNFSLWLTNLKLNKTENNSFSNWRGRQQLIIKLKNKIKNLEKNIYFSETESLKKHFTKLSCDSAYTEDTFSGATSFGFDYLTSDINLNNKNSKSFCLEFNNLFKKNVRKTDLIQNDNTIICLKEELETTKNKLLSIKSRNNILLTENKKIKEQINLLFQKDEHDNKLIDSLLKQNKQIIENSNAEKLEIESLKTLIEKEKNQNISNKMQNENEIKNLKVKIKIPIQKNVNLFKLTFTKKPAVFSFFYKKV